MHGVATAMFELFIITSLHNVTNPDWLKDRVTWLFSTAVIGLLDSANLAPDKVNPIILKDEVT